MQLYPKEEEDDSGLQTFASIPDDGAMELIDRSYLRKASARSSERNTAGGDTVKDLVYPYGNAQTITLSGSTKLMVWLDDDQSRNLANKTALYYSILRDGEWSEPAQVENDGTPDFDFSLCRAGSGAALVWQDAKEQVAENVTEEELAKKVELSYIEYDGGEFQEVISLTEGESYEYSPKLYSTYSIVMSYGHRTTLTAYFRAPTIRRKVFISHILVMMAEAIRNRRRKSWRKAFLPCMRLLWERAAWWHGSRAVT